MKRRSIVLLVLLIFAVLGLTLWIKQKKLENPSSGINEEYSYKTFQIDKDKWGYLILHFEKKIIKQKHVPAIEGNIWFKTEEDARNTAKLVVEKLKKKEVPALTEDELKQLGVIP